MKKKETKLNLKFLNLSYKEAKGVLVDLLSLPRGVSRHMLALEMYGDIWPTDLMVECLQSATASKKNWASWKKVTITLKAYAVKHQLDNQS